MDLWICELCCMAKKHEEGREKAPVFEDNKQWQHDLSECILEEQCVALELKQRF